MKIKYISKDLRDMKITPDIESLIEKKITQGLKKYAHNNQEQLVTVRVSEKKPRIRVDLEMMYLSYKLLAEADVTPAQGIVGGVEKCLDILERQIEKYRTRIHRSVHKNKGLSKADLADIDMPADNFDEDGGRKIIKVEDYELKPMNLDEAILQLEVLEYKFLFFYNTETGSPGVVYKRDDGNIGLIEG
jgi:putative sigma-54 modulation protein